MSLRYYSQFTDFSGRLLEIRIEDRDFKGEKVKVVAASTPFTTATANNDDPMSPLKYETGEIRLVNRGEFDGFFPVSSLQCRVVLVDVYDQDRVLWEGYVVPSSYSLPVGAYPEEVAFDVASPMKALSDFRITFQRQANTCIAEVLSEAFRHLDTSPKVYYPGNVQASTSGETSHVFQLVFSSMAFHDKGDEVGMDGEEHTVVTGVTVGEFIEDFCTYFGWVMFERPGQVWFVDYWCESYEGMDGSTFSRLTGKGEVIADYYVDAASFRLPLPGGTGHKVDRRPPDGSVSVSSDVLEFSGEVFSLKPGGFIGQQIDRLAYDGKEATLKVYDLKTREGSAVFHMYDPNTFNPVQGTYEEVDKYSKDCGGGFYASVDTYEPEDGGTMLERTGAFSFKDGIVLTSYWNEQQSDKTLPDGLLLVDLKNEEPRTYTRGCFIMSGRIQMRDFVEYKAPNRYFRLHMKLRVGDVYWDGSGWVSDAEASFDVPLVFPENENYAEIKNTNSPNSATGVREGYVISVPGNLFVALSGDTELQIISKGFSWGNGDTDVLYKYHHIFDFSLAYEYEDSDLFPPVLNAEKLVFKNASGTGGDYEADKVLHSKKNTPDALGQFYDGEKGLEKLRYSGKTGWKEEIPEVNLLAKLEKVYCNVREVLSYEAVYKEFNPVDRFMGYGVGFLVPLGTETDWRERLQTLYLYRLTQ